MKEAILLFLGELLSNAIGISQRINLTLQTHR